MLHQLDIDFRFHVVKVATSSLHFIGPTLQVIERCRRLSYRRAEREEAMQIVAELFYRRVLLARFPQIRKTFAELTAEEKARYSHRGSAFRQFLDWCEKQFSGGNIQETL